MKLSPSSFKTKEEEEANATMLQASIDGKQIKITDFSLGIIPPPMCHHLANFESNVQAVSILNEWVLVLTETGGKICNWNKK